MDAPDREPQPDEEETTQPEEADESPRLPFLPHKDDDSALGDTDQHSDA